ncbi:MAG: aminopeptidase P N-terminal domain-containing protein [Longimicrobiaceae bacterium]
MTSVRALLGVIAAALVAAPTLAAAQIAPAEYAARREALLARVDSGVVVAFGNVEPVIYWPAFVQHPAFEYLTGFDEPDAALVMVKRRGASWSRIYVPPRNLRAEQFSGPRVGPAEVQAHTGLPGGELKALRATVDSLVSAGLPLYTVSDVHTTDFTAEDSLTRGSSFVAALRRDRPGLKAQSLDSVLFQVRALKSPAEVALLRRAAEISAAGHRQAMLALAPGCNEGEIQAVLEGTFRRMGGETPGYGSIVGSGPNALALHYMRNTRVARAGEVVVIDAATAYQHYSADVTRTLPVTGRFTPDQRAIYQLVLDTQAALVRQIAADTAYLKAWNAGRDVMEAGLARLGLIEAPGARYDREGCPEPGCRQVGLYAWHGYGGHGIGLEVHDATHYDTEPHAFRIGDVFTVEPGIYITPTMLDRLPDTPRNRAMIARLRPVMQRYANIGVRIEDDYALTANGLEWLSKDVPRDPDAVEALMARPSPPLPGGGTCGS